MYFNDDWDVSQSTIVFHFDPDLPLDQRVALARKGSTAAKKFLDDPANGLTKAVVLHVDMRTARKNP